MLAALLPEGRAPSGARCAYHPEREAAAICSRCGSFVCAPETIVYDRKGFCPKCCELPDVEWLEVYRRSLVEKRSPVAVVAWIGAFASLVPAAVAYFLVVPNAVPIVSAGAGTFVVAAAVERKWQPAIYLAPLSWWVVGAMAFFWLTGPGIVFPVLVFATVGYAIAINSARGRVALGRPVSRAQLLQDYRVNGDNPAAQAALGLGILGLLVPFVCILALWLALNARRAVNPNANPPVGRASDAQLATYLGLGGALITLCWAIFTNGFGLGR
jgi:hypothetical protein